MKRYKLISEDVVKNLIDFLDDVQFEAAKDNTTESHHQVNFCNFMIKELLNSYDGIITGKIEPKKNNKNRKDKIDETFIDWELPEDLTEEEFDKFLHTISSFLNGWEKTYNKGKDIKKDKKKKKPKPKKSMFSDMVQHCSLEEIKEMLLDDPELTDNERFDLYYIEHERVQIENQASYTLDQLCKKTGIGRYKEPPTKNDKKN